MYEVLHQDSRIPFAVESSLPPFVLEKELVDYPLRIANESVNEMKKKGKLKELLPKRITSDRRHLECFVTSLYLVATQVSYCAKGLMGVLFSGTF